MPAGQLIVDSIIESMYDAFSFDGVSINKFKGEYGNFNCEFEMSVLYPFDKMNNSWASETLGYLEGVLSAMFHSYQTKTIERSQSSGEVIYHCMCRMINLNEFGSLMRIVEGKLDKALNSDTRIIFVNIDPSNGDIYCVFSGAYDTDEYPDEDDGWYDVADIVTETVQNAVMGNSSLISKNVNWKAESIEDTMRLGTKQNNMQIITFEVVLIPEMQ